MHDADLHVQLTDSITVISALAEHQGTIAAIAARITASLGAGGTIYLCGNGGSAADAQHVAAEFVGRFLRERRPLPAVALTCNTSILTAVGNDYGFEQIFARQVKAHVHPQDCVVGISTSGQSANVLAAFVAARERGAVTIGFTGAEGDALAALCDECLRVPSTNTPRIQEAHLVAWHLICDLVECRFTAEPMSSEGAR